MSIQTIGACLATLGTVIAALLLAAKAQERTVKRLNSRWEPDQLVRSPSSTVPERRTWIADHEFSQSSRVLITSIKTKE
jgi:hypothetical protein